MSRMCLSCFLMHLKHEATQTYKGWYLGNHALPQQMNDYWLEHVGLIIALKEEVIAQCVDAITIIGGLATIPHLKVVVSSKHFNQESSICQKQGMISLTPILIGLECFHAPNS